VLFIFLPSHRHQLPIHCGDSFIARRSFVSFPKIFPLQRRREKERNQKVRDRGRKGGILLPPIDNPVGLPGEILLLRDSSAAV
jgi:hypothetical protein